MQAKPNYPEPASYSIKLGSISPKISMGHKLG